MPPVPEYAMRILFPHPLTKLDASCESSRDIAAGTVGADGTAKRVAGTFQLVQLVQVVQLVQMIHL